MTDKFYTIRPPAELFAEAYKERSRETHISPRLSAGLQEAYGIHPDRAEAFMEARLKSIGGRGPAPDPEDYKTPVVLPLFGTPELAQK
jgi:hypothetical protein